MHGWTDRHNLIKYVAPFTHSQVAAKISMSTLNLLARDEESLGVRVLAHSCSPNFYP